MHPGFADRPLATRPFCLFASWPRRRHHRIQAIGVHDIAGTWRSNGYAVIVAGSRVGGTEYRNHHLVPKMGRVASLEIMSVWECRWRLPLLKHLILSLHRCLNPPLYCILRRIGWPSEGCWNYVFTSSLMSSRPGVFVGVIRGMYEAVRRFWMAWASITVRVSVILARHIETNMSGRVYPADQKCSSCGREGTESRDMLCVSGLW